MEEQIQLMAWDASMYGLPGVHLTAIAYLAFHRMWPACKQVLGNLLRYVVCQALGYVALLALLFGAFGCDLHGGCELAGSWLFVAWLSACSVYFLAGLLRILTANQLEVARRTRVSTRDWPRPGRHAVSPPTGHGVVRLSRPVNRWLLLVVLLVLVLTTLFVVLLIDVVSRWSALVAAACMCVLWLLIFPGNLSREVQFDRDRRRIVVTWRGAWLRQRRSEWPLDHFRTVVSYYEVVALGRRMVNRVSLIAREKGQELCVDRFLGPAPRALWIQPPRETDGAREMRARLSSELGLPDAGYLGLWESLKDL